jgi:hypothetical protein
MGELKFRLKKFVVFGASQSRVRLVGIGLSFLTNMNDPALSSIRLSATLFPPPQPLKSTQDDGVSHRPPGFPEPEPEPPPSRRRPAIFLGNVHPFGASVPIARVAGLAVHNLIPFGEWLLKVHPFVIAGTTEAKKRIAAEITDLRLHFTVVASPSKSDPF